MSVYREQAAAALRVISVHPGPRYAWLGRVDRSLPPRLSAWLSVAERRQQFLNALCDELYASFYTQGEPAPSRRDERVPWSGDRALMLALGEANSGRGSWEPGWETVRVHGGAVVLQGPRLRVQAPREDVRGDSELRVVKDLPRRSPGYYIALGDAGHDGDLRIYWNVGPSMAPALMRAVTGRLNGLTVPFVLKVADHPARFGRRDSAVLYLPAEALEAVRDVNPLLRAGVPAFTRELRPGVGAAEHPPGDRSFGQLRCAVLAEGVLRAHDTGSRDRLAVVADVFAEHGIDLDAPYREPTRADHVL